MSGGSKGLELSINEILDRPRDLVHSVIEHIRVFGSRDEFEIDNWNAGITNKSLKTIRISSNLLEQVEDTFRRQSKIANPFSVLLVIHYFNPMITSKSDPESGRLICGTD